MRRAREWLTWRFAFKSFVLLTCVGVSWMLRQISGEYPGWDDGWRAGTVWGVGMMFFWSPLLEDAAARGKKKGGRR